MAIIDLGAGVKIIQQEAMSIERPPVRTFKEVLVSREAGKRFRQIESAISESVQSILHSGLDFSEMASKMRQSVKEFADASKKVIPKMIA